MTDANIPNLKRTTCSWQVSEVLQEAVNKYIAENPAKHKAALEFGDFLTSHTLAQVDTFKIEQRDIAGDEIQYQELHKLMRYHGLKPKDMEVAEILILSNKLGSTWKEQLTKEYEFTIDDFSGDVNPDN